MATADKSHECNPWVAYQPGSTGSENASQEHLDSNSLKDNPECGSDVCSTHSDTINNQSSPEKTQKSEYDSLPIFCTPHSLINTDSDGNLRIDKDVLDQIAKIDSKLNVVAIVGPYRSGKSYLLNRLAGSKQGFIVMSTAEAVTKGIWVFCRPHPKYQDQVLLFLDTEGLDDIVKDEDKVDNQILILVLLLCSTFIYNFTGSLARRVLEELRSVTEISKRIQLSDEKSDKNCGDIDIYFPFFILVLRDYNLDMKDEDAFFEEKVLSRKGDSYGVVNETRCHIRKQFKNRKCFTFVSPGDRNILRRLQDIEDDKIDEMFIEKCKQFTQFVYDKCPPNRINDGQTIDGKTFAVLTETYVEVVRSGNAPKIRTVLNTVTQTVNKQAVDKCMELYHSQMISMLQFPTSENSLLQAHQICSQAAISSFLSAYIYEKNGECMQLANVKILTAYEDYKRQDEDASIQKSEMTLQMLGAEMETRMENKFYFCSGGYNSYRTDLKELKNKYKGINGLGRKKGETLSKYLSEKYADEEKILAIDKTLTQKEQDEKVERLQEEAGKRLLRCTELARIEQTKLLGAEREWWTNMQLQQEEKLKEEMVKQATYLTEILEKRQEEEKRLIYEGFTEESAQMKKQIDDLKKYIDEFHGLGGFALIRRAFKTFFSKRKSN